MIEIVHDRLTGLDSSFLHLERGGAHMHVASTTLFAGPPPPYVEFRDHLASRLHLVPRFRQKVREVPFGQGRPVWVDDPHLNLAYHVRHTSLPPPGSEQQLRVLAARIFSQQLDRSKPLWEMWLVEGLEDDRFAIVGKTHHALVDGVSGVDISMVLFDVDREPDRVPTAPEVWLPDPEPTESQLLAEALVERAVSPREAVRGVRHVLSGPRRAAEKVLETATAAGTFATSWGAPETPFNVEIGPHRRFDWAQASLDDLKLVKNELGGTVNDVILAAVSGALGRYLRARGHSTAGLEMRAMVPVSIRSEDERGALGNRVTTMMAPLPVWCEDPVKRMHRVSAAMGDLKQSKQAMGATVLTQLTDFAPPTIAGQAARLQSRQRFFNLVVTNIPGPQFPLYLLGRRMERIFPMVPLAKRQAVCVGIMSYNGQVNFGLIGDYDAMEDLGDLAADLEVSLDELVEAAGGRRGFLRRFVSRAERDSSEAHANGAAEPSRQEGSSPPG
ncbi:MAG TPA: wax ester/triacylglycerol synthase family O-acyltransferase [Solirubrobacterales bacterium]|jgi:WS/DGAT/MGAT family acyltransferase|nr:wax ester/triacylglycerol synthase family O-acyltransferase [Solirubrobacterales bacterium]